MRYFEFLKFFWFLSKLSHLVTLPGVGRKLVKNYPVGQREVQIGYRASDGMKADRKMGERLGDGPKAAAMCTEIEGAAWGPSLCCAEEKLETCNGVCPPALTFS